MESHSENQQTRAFKKDNQHHTNGSNQHSRPSKSELLASAKVMADAARHQGKNKVDKAEVAGAAANLLHAASEYGKLEEKPIGKIVEKAENHLRQYQTSHSATTNAAAHSSGNRPGKDHGYSTGNSEVDHEGHSGGKSKYGEYIKLDEGILKKHSGGGGNTNETS